MSHTIEQCQASIKHLALKLGKEIPADLEQLTLEQAQYHARVLGLEWNARLREIRLRKLLGHAWKEE